jgi:hypothetical protein
LRIRFPGAGFVRIASASPFDKLRVRLFDKLRVRLFDKLRVGLFLLPSS